MGQLGEGMWFDFSLIRKYLGRFGEVKSGSEATWGDMAKLMGELRAEVTDMKPEPAFFFLPVSPVSALH